MRTQEIGRHKTRVYTDSDNYTAVKYHSTDVVRFNADEIILKTGGWDSVTTKVRMNQASSQFNLGYRVYQKDYAWYVDVVVEKPSGGFGSRTIPFSEGMVLKRKHWTIVDPTPEVPFAD